GQGGLKKHPAAGAAAVGVRDFLVAYNVNLATDDLSVARMIAAKIRESNGGLPGVRALAFKLHQRALVQVSMNLTDPGATPPEAAYKFIRREADALGVSVLEDELIGLLPRDVIAAAKLWDSV
ncbi:glutamate formiminotransferase, partial [Candidatus Margulisiibacteriota bacterium]